MANFFKGMVSIGLWTFRCYLHVALQSFTHLYHVFSYNFVRLISVLQVKYSVTMLHTFTLYCDAGPVFFIRSIRNVCKYRKCS